MSLPERKPKGAKTLLDLDQERETPVRADGPPELLVPRAEPEINFGAAATASSVAAFDRFFFELSQQNRRITRKRVVSALLSACEDPVVRAAVIGRLNK